MRPIPQTIEAIGELTRYAEEPDLLPSLQEMADDVERLVPDCMGFSIAWVDDGVTFTLEASTETIAVFDALQYLQAGPCTAAVDRGEGLETDPEALMTEESWQVFAQATAACGVRSSLTFPLTEEGRIVGSINLYGASDKAFDGHHQELADMLGVWAPDAVKNADLSFESRRRAVRAPERIRRTREIDRAVGILATRAGEDVEAAAQRLERAALEAGVTQEALARAVLHLDT
jgi:GAF domain-containing protein